MAVNSTALKPVQFQCVFCPDLKGIITQTNIGWAHITCVNWQNEIFYTDKTLTQVSGQPDDICSKLCCSYCKLGKKSKGLKIQCDYKTCTTAFHVRCAIYNNLIDYTMDNNIEDPTNSWNKYIFCRKHIEIGTKTLRDMGPEELLKRRSN